MVVLDPDTANIATPDGLALVANAKVRLVQPPALDQMKVCGKLMLAPLDGLLSAVVQGKTGVCVIVGDRVAVGRSVFVGTGV